MGPSKSPPVGETFVNCKIKQFSNKFVYNHSLFNIEQFAWGKSKVLPTGEDLGGAWAQKRVE